MALLRLLLALGLVWLCYRLGLTALLALFQPKASSLLVTAAAVGSFISAIGALLLTVRFVLPDLGEFLGNLIFNPGNHTPSTPREAAAEKAAWGDYEGAERAYEKILRQEPEDLASWVALSHLRADKLERPEAAVRTLQQALQHEWHAHDEAELSLHLAQILWKYQHDALTARELLVHATTIAAGTEVALRAGHLLRQLEQALPPS